MYIINKLKLRCPRCGSPMQPTISFNESVSDSWMECTSQHCHTYVDTYIPQSHQAKIHVDPSRYVGVFGGYGSGKTRCTIADDTKHMLSTPNGRTVVGSAVLSQVEQTYEADLMRDFPKAFVKSNNRSKKIYQLVNGHELLIKSYYDEELLRSLNASRVHIVEASAVDYEIFTQLKTRLRNNNGGILDKDEEGNPVWDKETQSFKFKADWRRGLIESNPSSGWIREEFLLTSNTIELNGSDYIYFRKHFNPDHSSHVLPTRLNAFLPPNFYEENAYGKADWWIARYLKGSFDYAEGMVYPNAYSSLCDPFEIPAHWPRLIGFDYGIRDESSFIFGAIDSSNGIIYIFDEIFINNVNYKGLSSMYKDRYPRNVPNNNLYRPAVMDGRSINKRDDVYLTKLGDLFKQEGVYFQPAQMEVDARVLKLNTLFETKTIKIFKSCVNLCRELMGYKFPDRSSDGSIKPGGDKPMDKNNHAINALEFLIMEAPLDMKNLQLQVYDYTGNALTSEDASRVVASSINPYAASMFAPRKTKQKQHPMESVFVGTGGAGDIPW